MKLDKVHKQRIGLAVQAANKGHVVVITVEHGETAKLGWVEFQPGMRALNHVIASGSSAQMYALVNEASDEFERQKREAAVASEDLECSAPSLQESGATSGV